MSTRIVAIIAAILLCALSGDAFAEGCGITIIYDGKGAGQVVFDIGSHISRGLSCNDCHERRGLTAPLFEMKQGASGVSMRKMALGLSCGYCHDGRLAFSSMDGMQCSRCHNK